MLAGLGLALLLRVQDGPWMYWLYLFAATVAIGSKHLITVRGKHVFNPSNLGIVVSLLAFAPIAMLTPNQWQASWWLVSIIVLAGILVTYRAKVLSLVAMYALAELVLFLVVPGSSDHYTLATLFLSPSMLVFGFYMITDPRTAPRGTTARVAYAVGIACLHWIFISLGFGLVSVFLPLTVMCLATPLLESRLAATQLVSRRR